MMYSISCNKKHHVDVMQFPFKYFLVSKRMDSFSLSSVVEYSQKGQCLRDSLHKEIVLFTLQNSSMQPGAPDENTMSSLQLESTAQSLENHSASDVPSQTLPSIIISQYDSPLELPEETDINPQPSVDSKSSNENGSQEKNEDSDNPLTSHFKTLFKGFGRYRSHESLASTKNGSAEDVPDLGLQREGPEGSSWLHFSARSNKREKTCFRSGGLYKAKGKEAQATLQRGDNSQALKNQVNREQPEATKAIFDLLKEISGLY